MKPRHKRRAPRTVISTDEREALQRISTQLESLQFPLNPDVLTGINDKLGRIETRLEDIGQDATRRGALAGAVAGGLTGGIIAITIMFIRAKLEL